MNDPELYEKCNGVTKRDATQFLNEYASKIRWKEFGERVIDVGCGDGSVTNILKTFLPTSYGKLLGCDISENMVNFANERYGDRRTEFAVLDIEGKVPERLWGNFDRAFSSYALHWVRNQQLAFENIHKLLADGGDCLLVILGYKPTYDMFRILSRIDKWSELLKDVAHFVSPYHDLQEPENEIKKMLEKVGFENIEVKRTTHQFIHKGAAAWRNIITAISPFNIPKNLNDDFMDDYTELIAKMRLIDRVYDTEGDDFSVAYSYDLIYVLATKQRPRASSIGTAGPNPSLPLP